MPVRSADASLADRELVATRTFDAPCSLVYRLWTDPEHVGKWWGPRGFTTTTQQMDVRPGGCWRFVMHGPGGSDYPNEIEYVELDPPHRLVYDHVNDPQHRTTVTFEETAGKTRVTVRMLFDTVQERDLTVRTYKADVGLHQHLESFDNYLAQSRSDHLVIVRTFDAPRERIWAMWTQAEHFARWWGPHGWTTPHVAIDPRPGGEMLVCMRSAGEFPEHWFKGVFEELREPERLVIRQHFCDANGDLIEATQAGLPPGVPSEQLLTVTLVDDGGRTRLTLEQTISPATAEGAGARIGWTQSLERLEAVLAES